MRHATRLALVLVLLGITALFQVESVQSKPLVKSSCTVTRNCDYGPPSSISCTSPNGTCSSGPESYGWVECDGSRQYCPPPQICQYPECTSFDGVSCPTGKKTTCSYWFPSGCRNYTCTCYGGQWLCP